MKDLSQNANASAGVCEILFVGEAWGQHEEDLSSRKKRPCSFVGASGFFLYQSLFSAGIVPSPPPLRWPGALAMQELWDKLSPRIRLTNVFHQRPGPLGDAIEQLFSDGKSNDVCKDLPKFGPGLWLKADARHHLARLEEEILSLKPNLVVLLGRTALWAMAHSLDIGASRGNVILLPFGKALPSYHPAAIFRRYSLLPVFQADMLKARMESQSPVFSRLRRTIWTNPSIEDLWLWWHLHGEHSSLLSIDIETVRQTFVSEVGIAASPSQALHIPFILEDKAVGKFSSFWPSEQEEVKAWMFVRHVCESQIPKIGQNILYDVQYLLKVMRIPLHFLQHDTMLQHHALFPGMEKGLGFLASIYCNEPQYKSLRRQSNKDNE